MSQTLLQLDLDPAHDSRYGRELSAQQALIRDHKAGHQVVIAGAGTGKTEALTQRVLRLLLEGAPVEKGQPKPVPLEGILALTFTDKAAAEMRARVYRGLVSRLRATVDKTERERLETMRARFFEANRILTFDSFNQKILAQFPDESSLSPGAQLLGDAGASQLRRELTRAFWDRCEAFDPAQKGDLWEFLARFGSRGDALKTVEKFALENSPEELARLAQLPLEDAWICHVENLARDFERQSGEKAAKDAAKIWRKLENALLSPKFEGLPAEVHGALLDAERIREGGAKGVVTGSGGWAKSFEKTIPFDFARDLEREILPLIVAWKALASEGGATLPRSERSREIEYASRRAVALCAGHAIWWQNARRGWLDKNGFADFSDFADAALRVVQKPKVGEAFQKSIAHILIDEFQDTNEAQWALIEAIRSKKTDNVLLVGDEKQAIYGFRGGDITVFDRVRKLLLNEQKAHELTLSRRSQASLVEFVNALFREILPTPEERESYEAPFQALQAAKDGEGGLWRLLARDFFPDADAFEKADIPGALALFLRDLVDDAEILRDNPRAQTPLRQPDFTHISGLIAAKKPAVGVLFTSHEVKATFENALREASVPFTATKGQGFFQSVPVQLTLHLLAHFLDESDAAPFVALARSPLGALSDLALLERHLEEPFSRGEDEQAHAILRERLDCWREMARLQPFSRVLEDLRQRADLAFWEALENPLDGGAQEAANWRKVIDLVREREENGAGSLRDLHDHFGALHAESQREPVAPLPSDGSIQLLTAHGAKGLEYPLVILAQLDGAISNRSPNLLQNPDGPREYAFKMADFDAEDDKSPAPLLYSLFQAQIKAREEAEWRRLFYVACTRAETDLLFVWPLKEKNGSWSQLCADHVAALPKIAPCLAPRRAQNAVEITEHAPFFEPTPLRNFEREEIGLNEIFGEKDENLKASQVRLSLEKAGFASENIREDVPFCVRADLLGVEGARWVFGAFDFLARGQNGKIELRASGSPERVAALERAFGKMKAERPGLKPDWMDL